MDPSRSGDEENSTSNQAAPDYDDVPRDDPDPMWQVTLTILLLLAAVVLVLLGGSMWMSDGFWSSDGAYSRTSRLPSVSSG